MKSGRLNHVLILGLVLICLPPCSAWPQDYSIEEPEVGKIEEMFGTMWGLAQAADGHYIFEGEYPSADSIEEFVEAVEDFLPSGRDYLYDAWGNEFMVSSGGCSFEIRSLGSDGLFDDQSKEGISPTLSADIVVRNLDYTEFVQCPRDFCDNCPPKFCDLSPNPAIPAARGPRERGPRPLNSDR